MPLSVTHTATVIMLFFFTISGAQIGTVVDDFPSPGRQPTGLAWDGRHLWNADIGTNRIYKIDPESGQVIHSLPGPAGATINGLTWDGEFLWCSDNANDRLCRLNTNDSSLAAVIPLATTNPRGVAWDGQFLWYVDSQARRLYQVNIATGSCIDTLDSPSGYNRGLVWDGSYFWCTDHDKDEIYWLERSSGRVFSILMAPGSYSYGLAFDGDFLWNADYEQDKIYRIAIAGSNKFLLYDPLRVTMQYTVTIRNIGSSPMNLKTYLAVPIENLRQELESLPQFKPTPHSFFTDIFGQRIAYFEETVEVAGEKIYQWIAPATLYTLRYHLHPDSVGQLSDIPPDIISLYTLNGEYYDKNHPEIQAAVREALGDETNFYWQVRNIHDYVISHIAYVNDETWDTAPAVLRRGTGSCSEYSFLFVSMCRAAGIPARMEAGGHLRSDIPYEDRIFHRWQQVYFPNYGWIPVDCTWDDKEYPSNQARYFGAMSSEAFATTISGGGVTGMWWTYNVANSTSGGEMEREKLMEWLPYSTAVEMTAELATKEDATWGNFPNPCNNATTFQFYTNEPGPASLQIYNSLGQMIHSWPGLMAHTGWNRVTWTGRDEQGEPIASGVYLYRIETGDDARWYKMTVVK